LGTGSLRVLALTFAPFTAGVVASSLGLRAPEWLLGAALHVLVALAGFEIGYSAVMRSESIRSGLVKGAAFAVAGLVAGAAVASALSIVTGLPPCISAVVGAASGWYTLAAPVVATAFPQASLLALAANMLREQLHIVLYPLLARRGLRLAAVALGGATTMDTGLPAVMAVGDAEAVSTAIAQGTVLTALLPAVLPLILQAC